MAIRLLLTAAFLGISAATLAASSDDALPLDLALNRLFEKTEIRVADRRSDRSSEPKVRVDFKSQSLWQIVDSIAKQANLRVSVHEPDRKIALRDGPWVDQPISHHAAFRACMKRFKTTRDWESRQADQTAIVEIAWLEGFLPMLLEVCPGDSKVEGEPGKFLAMKDGSIGRYRISLSSSAETSLRFEAAPRTVQKLASVRGRVQVIGANKLLKFRFDDVSKLKAGQKMERDGVQVLVEQADLDDDLWTIRISTDYPTDGPAFETFEDWLAYHRFALHSRDGLRTVAADDNPETSPRSHSATITYRLSGEALREAKKRKKSEWSLEICCPSPFQTFDVPFEFKNVDLP